MIRHAGVGAERDLHAGLDRRADVLPVRRGGFLGFRERVLRARAGPRLRQRGVRRDDRRDEPRAVLLEQRVRLRVGVRAVLDRVDAGFERRLDPVLSMRVRRDLAAEHVRRIDDRLHLLGEHLLIQSAGDVAVHAARCGELDDVGALRDLLAHRAAAFVRAVAEIVGVRSRTTCVMSRLVLLERSP